MHLFHLSRKSLFVGKNMHIHVFMDLYEGKKKFILLEP